MKYEWVAFTDGGCKGGKATIGGVVLNMATGDRVTFSLGVKGEGTNNIAELSAIAYALKQITTPPSETSVLIKTDSQYAIGVLTLGHKAKANAMLVAKVKALMKPFASISMEWVRGHSGHEGNSIADYLATDARRETQKL